MKTIGKFPLRVDDYQTVALPVGSQILTAQVQGDAVCLWAIVDTSTVSKFVCPVWIHGTGQPVGDAATKGRYLATVQLYAGSLVFHVFVGPTA